MNLASKYLRNRELAPLAPSPKFIPLKPVSSIETDARIYCLQYLNDGHTYFTASQDHKLVFRDTSDKVIFQIKAQIGQWSITDYTVTPDSRFMAYSSLVPYVHLARITDDEGNLVAGKQTILPFSERDSFAIWSIKFSGDGRELVAGTNDESIYVYDIETRKVLHRIIGHEDDINSVCYADPNDPNILLSGSDDHVTQ